MIHIIEKNHIDVNKLERVSELILSSKPFGYFFRYSVNGFTWDTNIYYNKTEVNKIREDLMHSWYLLEEKV